MPGLAEANGPSYISAHSADVILSDIRPFKLKADALRSINVLLDEILYNILSSSGSLVTDRLRVSLLSLLPTSLGKEALLEAEVELRAYWERTAPAGFVPSVDDDTATFHLACIFELLRNKCEAYSTLNEADEDPSTEAYINERFGRSGAALPKAALVAPAALYLTAILEAICEHVLSNVGRVAARDSSRTTATLGDLFTALCEDASIYGYFRTMKVYDQIDQLSKTPKQSRRSKSFSRNDISRTSTPQQDPATTHPMTSPLSRHSSASSSAAGHPSRSSFDKSRALRMFSNGKSSHEREESQTSHKKSTSLPSDTTKRGSYDDEDYFEDAAMLQEFDDLMRSASTMKVSLTPDRLRTMEVYRQEKERGARRPAVPLPLKSETDPPSFRSPLPSARHVESIVEDDEEGSSPKQLQPIRIRQGSVGPSPSASVVAPPSRARSVSTSSPGPHPMTRKPVRTPMASVPSAFPSGLTNSASNPNLAYARALQVNSRGGENGGPVRKRVKQRNRESLDLDDVMNGSEDEDEATGQAPPARPPMASPPKRVPKVSTTTRELMDFLAEGPPVSPPDGKFDFLAEGSPKHFASSTVSLEKPKTGRLQRMISKLNLGNEKSKSVSESPVKNGIHYRTRAGAQQYPNQTGAFSPLANRPIPPRPPLPPQISSPPSSPSQVSLADENNSKPLVRKVVNAQEQHRGPSPPIHSTPSSPLRSPQQTPPKSIMKEIPTHRSIPNGIGNGVPKPVHARSSTPDTHPFTFPPPQPVMHSLTRKPVPKADLVSPPTETPGPGPAPALANPALPPPPPAAPALVPSGISEADMHDMKRLFASATTADECRLIFDMYMARLQVAEPRPKTSTEVKAPYPTPSPSLIKQSAHVKDAPLENSVVELLLGGEQLMASPSHVGKSVSSCDSRPASPLKSHVAKPEPANTNTHEVALAQQENNKKSIDIATTCKNTDELPTYATLIPV